MTSQQKSFASDNYAGIHPDILKAIADANQGSAPAYGADSYTQQAIEKFKEHFGEDIEVFFVFNGTGANVLSIKAMTHAFNAVICAQTAHLNVDECGAPEKYTGCKLIDVPTTDGKLTVDLIAKQVQRIGDQHYTQPKVVSITQATEYGTIYSAQEIKAIANFVHQHNMLLHVDGSRLANAAVSLKVSLKAISKDIGVDVLSFGGTKNGMMLGEAVIFFDKTVAENFSYIRKQGMQLNSKMRFISAQFSALLSNDLWRKNAAHANLMTQKLAAQLKSLPKIIITQPVQANAIFAKVPQNCIPLLQEKFSFYIWNEEMHEVRWMTSFATTEKDVDEFAHSIRTVLKSLKD